ncbi:MAG TPA: Chromate resistance protein ChrB [Steroidobacteraceae bacterium]|nr:Chromate resistance protein ChrB [Steroidobacteraceae bacterium]
MIHWLLLILSLPTENGTARQRAWRSLKASGAAVLRDGVYLMPETQSCRATLEQIGAGVRDGGGTAHLLRVQHDEAESFRDLFNRSAEYDGLRQEVESVLGATEPGDTAGVLRQARRLRKAFGSIRQIDYFPDAAQRQAEQALLDLERRAARTASPDEPAGNAGGYAPQR